MLLVFRHRFRHERAQLFHPRPMRWMRGRKFRWLTSASFAHPFPESDTLPRVVTSARHVKQTHLVSLGFVIAAERKKHTVLRTGTERGHHGGALLIIHVAHRELRAHHQRLR